MVNRKTFTHPSPLCVISPTKKVQEYIVYADIHALPQSTWKLLWLQYRRFILTTQDN